MATLSKTTNTIVRLVLAAGLTAVVATGAVSPAIAQSGASFQDQGIRDMNGLPPLGKPAWHSGANASAAVTRNARPARTDDALAARAQVRQRSGAAVDDPPGSAYQTFGNDQSNGLVR
jgi:hypothetical protein